MAYRVERAGLESDRDEILAFWDGHHSTPLGPKYRQFYVNNPAGPATVWLLKREGNGRAVGMISLFKRTVWVGGKKYLAGVAGDVFVAPRHRALGPALMLARKVVDSVDRNEVDFLYTFPNKRSEIIIKRAGCRCLGSWGRFARVTDVAPYLLERGIPSMVVKLIGPVVNGVRYRFSRPRRVSAGQYVCRQIFFDSVDCESLWNRCRRRYKIIGDRSREYLKWRFGSTAGSRVFGVFGGARDRLLGYMACSLNDNHLKVHDFLLPDEADAEALLISRVVGYAHEHSLKNVYLHILQNSLLESRLIDYGFSKRDNDRRVYCYGGAVGKGVFPFFQSPQEWYLLSADSDT